MFATEADRATADCKKFMAEWERATTHASGVYQKEFRAMELAQMQAIQKEAALQQTAWREMEVEQNAHLKRQLSAEEAYQAKAYRDMEVALLKQARLQEQAALKAASGPSARERRLAARAIGAPTTLGADLAGGIGAGVLGGAALLGVGAFAFKAATDVQSAFNTIRATTGETGASLSGLEDTFKHLGGTVPNSLSQTATAIATLHQRTGLTGTALESFARQELTLARVTGTDVGEAIKKTTQLFNNWGVSLRDQPRYLDLLFKASQQTGASFTRLAEGMTRGGSQLRQFGFSFSEAAALMGKFDHEGVAAQQGVRTLQMVLAHMAKAGIGDAHAALAEFMRLLKAAPSDMAANEMAAKALGLRAGPQFAAMVREGRFEYEKTAAAIAGSHDTIMRTGKDTETLGTAWAEAKNQLELALSPLGKSLIDVLKESVSALKPEIDGVQALGEAFGHLPGPGQQAILVLGGLSAIALTLGPEIALIVAGIGALGAALQSGAFQRAKEWVDRASTAVLGKPGPGVMSVYSPRAFQAPTSTPSSGFGALHETEFQAQRMAGDAPVIAAGTNAKSAWDKFLSGQARAKKPPETPYQREAKAYNEELARTLERLNALRSGESDTLAEVAGRYRLLSAAQQQNLARQIEAVKGVEAHRQKLKEFHAELTRVNSQIRDRLQIHPAGQVMREYGVTEAQAQALVKARDYKTALDQRDKDEEEYRNKLKGAADALREQQIEQLKLTHARLGDQIALERFGVLYKQLDGDQRHYVNALERETQVTAALKSTRERNQKAWEALGAAGDKERQRQAVLSGSTKDVARAEDELFRKINLLNPAMVAAANRVLDMMRANDAAEMSAKAYGEQQGRLVDALTQAQAAHRAATAATDMDAFSLSVMGKTVSELDFHLQDLLKRLYETAKASQKIAESKAFLEAFAQGTHQVFTQVFNDLYQHGFKGFFANVVKGFQQMLQQIAAEYLASKLTDLIFGKSGPGGQRSGGLIDALGSVIGGLFGGHRAMGGDVMGGRPYLVGERGPELIVPRSSGTVIPNAALAGAGGTVHNHFNFTIHTPNPQAFRQSQHQIMGDAQAAAEAHRKRRGY